MPKPATGSRRPPDANNKELMALVKSIVSGNTAQVLEIIEASPDLVQKSATTGASREAASQYFFPEIRHYLYAGDTALHMAAAGFKFELGQVLIDHGANCAAKNRRGAEPLHYASEWMIRGSVDPVKAKQRRGGKDADGSLLPAVADDDEAGPE